MTTYNTADLAAAIIGEDAPRKTATRTLRKFLRTDFASRDLRTPGKGGRYSIDLNKRELSAMTNRFKKWESAENDAKAKRAEEKAKKTETDTAPIEDTTPETDNEVIEDDEDTTPEGPSDEEIAAMLSDDDIED
ncbi:hypothetical protein ACWIG4_30260 [Streptomyces sp. NPDC002248]